MANDTNLFFICYARLTAAQKSVYSELLPEIEKANRTIAIRTKASSDDVFAAVRAIRNDRPEIFWMTGQAQVWTRNSFVERVELEYNALANRLSYHKQLFQKAVDEYMRIVKGKPLLEQERMIHDKMVQDISYQFGTYDQTAYSALVENRSVCAGYTRGFQYLMQLIGIPCYYCAGVAKGKGSDGKGWGPHSWNIMKLGPDYYNMDITWDDCFDHTSDQISYMYYNCTDAKMTSDHMRDKEYDFLPKCNGTKYSFEHIFGVSPELQVILQDGVTCRTVIQSKTDFFHIFIPEVKRGPRGTIHMSFPTQKEAVQRSIGDWVTEAIRSVYGQTVGWSLSTRYTDYKNGWYRIELNLSFQ